MMKKHIMRRSTRSFNIPPGHPPAHLNFSRLACSNSYPQGGQKLRSKVQPNFFLKEKISDRDSLHRHGLSFKLWLSLTLKTFSPGSFYRESELFTLNNSIFKDVTLVLIWKDLKLMVHTPHPNQGRFEFPTLPRYGRRGCWRFKSFDVMFYPQKRFI